MLMIYWEFIENLLRIYWEFYDNFMITLWRFYEEFLRDDSTGIFQGFFSTRIIGVDSLEF